MEVYPLVMTNIAMDNGPVTVDLPNLKVVMFNSYVSLQEGMIFRFLTTNHIPSFNLYLMRRNSQLCTWEYLEAILLTTPGQATSVDR